MKKFKFCSFIVVPEEEESDVFEHVAKAGLDEAKDHIIDRVKEELSSSGVVFGYIELVKTEIFYLVSCVNNK